jgi:hypothetical protein
MAHLGIETLKPAVIGLVKITNAGYIAASDGIQVVPDLISLIPSVMALPGIYENREKAIAEGLDLSSAEIDEIASEVETTMEYGSAKARNVTEKALIALGHNLNLIIAIREPEVA